MQNQMEWIVPAEAAGERLDQHLQAQLPEFSRSRLQGWVKEGLVQINGATTKASLILRGGEQVAVQPAALPALEAVPEDLPLEILYEDEDVVVVNKAAGVVVHAGAGNHTGTLVNALLFRFGALSSGSDPLRPGIVHRLDKETSGVLVVAKTDAAHRSLAEQFENRRVEKTYLALVHGVVAAETGQVDKPIARDPHHRTKMTCRLRNGRSALTWFTVLRRFAKFTYLQVGIGTGRTHQIRVHLASLKHPILGDRLYGAPAAAAEALLPNRFFLHAWRLQFQSPSTGRTIAVEAPLPAELVAIIEAGNL